MVFLHTTELKGGLWRTAGEFVFLLYIVTFGVNEPNFYSHPAL